MRSVSQKSATTAVDAVIAKFGRGQFTCGAVYLCFLPENSTDYVYIAKAPEGTEDSPEWSSFSEAIMDLFNARMKATA